MSRTEPQIPGRANTSYKPDEVHDRSSLLSKIEAFMKKQPTCDEECLSIVYGSLIRTIQLLKLDKYAWVVSNRGKDCRDWDGNVNRLLEGLSQPIIRRYPSWNHSHSSCRPDCGLIQVENDIRAAMDLDNLSDNVTPDVWKCYLELVEG